MKIDAMPSSSLRASAKSDALFGVGEFEAM
jgi:hypothetical protein